MRWRIFWYQDWQICNFLSWYAIQFTEGYFREKSTIILKKEHRSILTESCSNRATWWRIRKCRRQRTKLKGTSGIYISYLCIFYGKTSKNLENSQSESLILRAPDSSDTRPTKAWVARLLSQFFKGYTHHIVVFLQTHQYAWLCLDSSRKSLKNPLFSIICHFLLDMLTTKSVQWRTHTTRIRCSFPRSIVVLHWLPFIRWDKILRIQYHGEYSQLSAYLTASLMTLVPP